MSHRRFVVAPFLTVVSAALLAGCDGPHQVGPSPPVSIQVSGPDSVQSGSSAQFVVIMRLANGSTKSATSMPNLTWASSNPSVMSVSDSGMVTAASLGSGEAVITAEIMPSAGLVRADAMQGKRKVVIQPRAIVTVELEVSLQGTPGLMSYVFALKFTESVGVPATVTGVFIGFDDNAVFSPQCDFGPDKLSQTRLPANGTLALDPITCGGPDDKPFNVVVDISLKDDYGYQTRIVLVRQPVIR
jgi:hypothetical protein